MSHVPSPLTVIRQREADAQRCIAQARQEAADAVAAHRAALKARTDAGEDATASTTSLDEIVQTTDERIAAIRAEAAAAARTWNQLTPFDQQRLARRLVRVLIGRPSAEKEIA